MPNNEESLNIFANRSLVSTITVGQFLDIFTIYKDEPLANRPFVEKALDKRSITINEIRSECDKLNLPWQIFLLDSAKLSATIRLIHEKRRAKFSEKLISNRDGSGRGISLRLADRVIALQEYAKGNIDTPNAYCGSLVRIPPGDYAQLILDHFCIDPNELHGKTKEVVLKYLINQLEAKNLRVARGVLSNKILPKAPEIAATYKKSSGFIVHDDCVPYLFLPGEVSEQNETAGRQILTLLSLVVLVGKGEHNLYINGDLESHFQLKQSLRQAFEVAGEILIPVTVTDRLRGQIIDGPKRDELATEYMLTPSAVVVTLRNRDIINSDQAMDDLLQSIPAPGSGRGMARTPKMETSVKKFCGDTTATEVMRDIANGSLRSIPAQYLLFGHIDKNHFAKLKSGMGL